MISNEPAAAGLGHAERAGIPTQVIDHRGFSDREGFESEVDAALRAHAVEFVCLAGFMRVLTDGFVRRWHDRVINIHPSLLPAFRGLDTHRRALEAGVRIAGCTVHFIRPSVDDGPVIVQGAVPVYPDDDPESLAARVLTVEHRIYPLALRLIGEGRVKVVGEKVVVSGATAPETVLINPVETPSGGARPAD